MQVVILCGGAGTRMYPTTEQIPKPMLTVGDKPILWHIMKFYSKYGHNDFILLTGFRSEMIKEYFNNPSNIEPNWKIQYSDAGLTASKGDRLRQAYSGGLITDDNFLLAYGDDLCNVDINEVIKTHEKNSNLVTLTSVPLVSDFGILKLNEDDCTVMEFEEKPKLNHWINGGYIVMNKKVLDYLVENGGDETDAFKKLAVDDKVQVFKHDGFWKSMNTIKDMNTLRDMCRTGELQKYLEIYG